MEEHKIVIISGGFDPLHIGHIQYIRKANELKGETGRLFCILNSDSFLFDKKGFIFQKYRERYEILSAIKYIDYIHPAIDLDNTVCKTIQCIYDSVERGYGDNTAIIFAKGGDRNIDNIPEKAICDKLGIKIVDGLGDKIQSSSELTRNRRVRI